MKASEIRWDEGRERRGGYGDAALVGPTVRGALGRRGRVGWFCALVLSVGLSGSVSWGQQEKKSRAGDSPHPRSLRPKAPPRHEEPPERRSEPGPRRWEPAPGWERVAPGGFEAAEESARIDAMERLARRIEGLRLSPTRRVDHFAATSPAIREGLREPFAGVKLRKAVFSSDRICSMRATVDLAAVVDQLKRLNRRYGDGRYDEREFDQIWSLNPVESLEVMGQGVPSIDDAPRRRGPVVRRGPTWAELTRRETGFGRSPRGDRDSVSGKLVAAREAREEAREKLAAYARRLPLFEGGDRCVGDELERNATADLRFQSWVRSARTLRTEWDRSGNAHVEIEGELTELWDIVAPEYRTPPPDEIQIRIRSEHEKEGKSLR